MDSRDAELPQTILLGDAFAGHQTNAKAALGAMLDGGQICEGALDAVFYLGIPEYLLKPMAFHLTCVPNQ